jgi:UDP-2-acetamido-3-amino-2,3-dideoxy-glucuronate N-acetyltransferase
MYERSIAVIGSGYWGKNLVRVFSELQALHTVCDADSSRFASLKWSNEAPNFVNNLDIVLAEDQIRGVAIATPAITHFSIVKRCLEAGKDVFVEKPLALTAREGEELVRLANSLGRMLMVGHILLYHPAVKKLKSMISDGTLGKILYCYSNRLNMGLIRTEENILWSFAPHDISVMLHLLGEEPIKSTAEGSSYLTPGVVDVTMSRLTFKSGVTGHIFVSWLHPSKEQKFVVVGSEGMAVFDDTSTEKLKLFPHKVDWTNRVPTAVKESAVTMELEQTEPLKEECKSFLNSIATRVPSPSDGEEGLRVLRVLDSCQRSLESRRSSDLHEVITDRHASENKAADAKDYFAHESAYIDEPCSIGKGTKIWHFSHIMKGATIGENCSIGQNVVVASTVKIGNGVKIQNNVSIYDGVTLEDDVFCGPSMVFTNVINPRSAVVRKSEYKATRVGKGVSIGANATIVCGNDIGEFAFIGAGAVVTKNVPPYALMTGVPAKQVGWVSQHGDKMDLPLTGGGVFVCNSTGDKYSLRENSIILEQHRL